MGYPCFAKEWEFLCGLLLPYSRLQEGNELDLENYEISDDDDEAAIWVRGTKTAPSTATFSHDFI